MWEIIDTTLAGMYLVSLWGGIGSRNAKFNCIPFALRAERYRTRWTAFHSTRCAERALLISGFPNTTTEYDPPRTPHPFTHYFSTEPHMDMEGEGSSISLPSSDISPMCQFPPRTRASQDTRSQQKRNAQRTLPAASRRARVPPRTRIVGAF